MTTKAAVIAVMSLAMLSSHARAENDADFDALTRAGFAQIAASAAKTPAPAVAGKPAIPPGGVYLHSWREGRLFYCSQAGCRMIKSKDASLVVSSGKGGLYFTGEAGTGYCENSGCRVLLPGVRVTFPLGAGPEGDIWAANKIGGWHCTPASCREAFSGAMQGGTNYLDGVYKRNGDFVGESDHGVFWCSGDKCSRVGTRDMLFIEDNCKGRAPASAVYGFSGPQIFRCSPEGCRLLVEDDKSVDNYVDCSFDAQERLHLPVRGADGRLASGSLACSESGCFASAMDAPKRDDRIDPASPERDGDWSRRGDDGQVYSLVDLRGTPQNGAWTLPPVVKRDGAALSFDAPASCWRFWTADDDDEVGPAWVENCRLLK